MRFLAHVAGSKPRRVSTWQNRRLAPNPTWRWQRDLVDLVLPPICALCGVEPNKEGASGDFCERCRGELARDWFDRSCPTCGLPIGDAMGVAVRCRDCRRESFRFSSVVSVGWYAGWLRLAVIRMKQAQEQPLTAAAGRLLSSRLQQLRREANYHAIVPISKHWWKRLWRGVNSAEVLAHAIGETLGPRVIDDALYSRRTTHKQSLLSVEARRRNVKESFRLTGPYDWRGATILLVDDIMTTGATANEAATVLRGAGASRVDVAVLARAIPGDRL